jgi:DNA polymerase-3 subunit gamma/tau
LLKDCRPVAVEGDTVILGFPYPFHRQRIEEPRGKAVVEVALNRVLGGIKHIRCVLVDKEAQSAGQQTPKTTHDLVADDPLIRVAVEKYGAEIAEVRSEVEVRPPDRSGQTGGAL